MNLCDERTVIVDLIENYEEGDYLDFKREPYAGDSLIDFLKDVVAFANADCTRDRYIIFGVEDKTKKKIGINPNALLDSASYQKLLSEKVEPEIAIEIGSIEYQELIFGFIKIPASNKDRPYIFKEEYQKKGKKIDKGLLLIRRGSYNTTMNRSDLDKIYSGGKFEVSFYGGLLFVAPIQIENQSKIDNELTLGQIHVLVRNFTERPVTIDWGILEILDSQGNLICDNRVMGIGSYQGADLCAYFNLNDEKILPLLTDFNSTHCIILNLDDDGTADDNYTLKLTLKDLSGNTHTAMLENCFIKARGPVLHKIQRKYINMRSYLKVNFKALLKAINHKDYMVIEKIMQSSDVDFKLVKADHIANKEAFPETHYIYELVKLAVEKNDEKLLNYFKKIGLDERIIQKAQGVVLDNKLPNKDFKYWDDILKKEYEEFIESRRFDE
ncbi:ATP-binding protein [Ruminiclostridium herbifermentans]|uniref:ATP-binding protein n=1 Tax=Ruminiclostridium herbifermentans TaxID=2488810 RepID=A0A4U7J7Y8_9FIRM|nr:ATP-binding protein [Ruminiclostridium herbifermentans]QNU66521.1 ATP-binding protein [Ruminiclostridium herbifermentans]